ncbi:cofactor-independent phosphoglycerate mutase [Hippea maritima]|uniref:Proposed homoserine kinase n=1 Tax=Hippea maritima (strain ATCC 700847 / DSM 10411 / MH2) TaxID=760142 RepID=F2LXJ0_HIPMA|nr:cofactor-independent phosphoglycerate mutase [Hippea maritima]AEA33176.1 proposed homoserine kinase [Hippea maritima DSM 10411]
MKYMILLGDGMADWPIEKLGGKTPLEYANTPNMDIIASGIKGMVKTVPEGMHPGSDVANMSVLGYNPKLYYTGRAPLEAISKDIKMDDNDVAYRCNFVSIEDNIMKDFSAGHIPTEKSSKLIQLLNEQLKEDGIEFYTGVSYRNLMIWRGGETDITTPPHDISDQSIYEHLPKGEARDKLISIMDKTKEILKDNTIYPKANAIWLWGEGKKPSMPLFRDEFGKDGCMISAVDLMVGLGKLTGMFIPQIEGLTGFLDTNFEGKIDAAFEFLQDGGDFVYLHVEATDETGHMGDVEKKIEAIELFDRKIVGEAIKRADSLNEELRIAVLPDHPTPIKIKTHTAEAVPFAVWDSKSPKKADSYTEASCKNGLFIENGHEFIRRMLFKE